MELQAKSFQTPPAKKLHPHNLYHLFDRLLLQLKFCGRVFAHLYDMLIPMVVSVCCSNSLVVDLQVKTLTIPPASPGPVSDLGGQRERAFET